MSVADQMLQHITDPGLQAKYASILNGQVEFAVHCNSKQCAGHIIAYLDTNGSITEIDPITPTEKQRAKASYGLYVSGLEGSRQRLDGQWGFRCYCGNNSILASHEQGIIGSNPPTKRDLEKIFGKLQEIPTNYVEQNGLLEVDGFTLERIA